MYCDLGILAVSWIRDGQEDDQASAPGLEHDTSGLGSVPWRPCA
jgi:hypothetical protein